MDDLVKIFDFILDNEEIDINVFGRNDLTLINKIIKGKVEKNFILSDKQSQILIDVFLKKYEKFDDTIPNVILNDKACINKSLDNDTYTVDYINYFDSEIINKILKSRYILHEGSNNVLKSNFKLAYKSIKLDVNSCNYIDYDGIYPSKNEILINEILKSNYILSSSSPNYLKNNKDIVFHSIKKDISTIEYANCYLKNDKDIFEYLILNGYEFSKSELLRVKLSSISNIEVLKKCLKMFFDDDKYINNISKLVFDMIDNKPTIKSFYEIFRYIGLKKWNEYYEEEEDFVNIPNIICQELRNLYDIDDVNWYIYEKKFICKIKNQLGKKSTEFEDALWNYYININDLEKSKKYRDQIFKLSNLYIVKCREKYVKDVIDELYKDLYTCYTLNLNNKYVSKKLNYKYQMNNFKTNGDKDFIHDLIIKYSKYIEQNLVKIMIRNYLSDITKFEFIIIPPKNYDMYEKYKKVSKLVKRLNKKYISYNGVEVKNYKDMISYDDGKYFINELDFDELECSKYELYKKVFESIKKDISLFVNEKKSLKYNKETLCDLKFDIPFKDNYYEFDKKCLNIPLEYIINRLDFNEEIITDEKYFKLAHNILIKNNVIYFLFLKKFVENYIINDVKLNVIGINNLIDNLDKIVDVSNLFNLNMYSISDTFKLNEVSMYATPKNVAILGSEVIEKMCNDTCYKYKSIFNAASDLVCEMSKRNYSTVPRIKGEYKDLKYSLYDFLDEFIITSGIDTDACFKIDGEDSDFLYYCALDKNGFVMKITDENNNFLARASGFRHGNIIYINQLRSIYDEGGITDTVCELNIKNDIVNAFKCACSKFLNEKINFVFVTKSYLLCDYESNVTDEINDSLPPRIMDNYSEDWYKFIENKNVECNCYFETDFGNYSLICIANNKELSSSNLKFYDATDIYKRDRNKIIVSYKNSDVINKINKIRAIESYFTNIEFKQVKIDNEICIVGDNWYIIYNGEILDYCVLDNDAKEEASKVVLLLKELEKNNEIVKIKNKIYNT